MTREFPARVQRALASVRKLSAARPKVGIVLGSGLSSLAATFGGTEIPFRAIESFPQPTVSGHAGVLFLGEQLAVLAGRFHYYEGHTMDTVCLPTALLAALGAETIILTNAAGGINSNYQPGDLVLISDHINMQGANPLVGPSLDRFGPRFPDMSSVYDAVLRDRARSVDPSLKDGVYLAVSGPNYETPAEIRAYRLLGADLVGMSTVPEAILARSLGLKVVGISVVTNLAAGLNPGALNHQEVVEVGRKAGERLGKLLVGLTRDIL